MVGAPPTFIVLPKQISFCGNFYDGAYVTAEEAFAKACNSPEIFISENEAMAWATNQGMLNCAYLTQVINWMQNDRFVDGPFIYEDGAFFSVDWTNAAPLQSAIWTGPVKLGVAGDHLDTVWWAAGGGSSDGHSGWFASRFQPDANEDHCVSLCGYGSLSWLAQQLRGALVCVGSIVGTVT